MADFPPSSSSNRFSVPPAAAMMSRPTAVDPVKVTMSTRGSSTRARLAPRSDVVTTLTTPGGMSVASSTIRARASPANGESGDGLRTTVLPAASAGPSFMTFIVWGKFHGVMADTTPTGS